MKSTLEGIQPADGEVRAEDGLHQCQVGVLKLLSVEVDIVVAIRISLKVVVRN